MGSTRTARHSSRKYRASGAVEQNEAERCGFEIGLGIISPSTLPPPYTQEPTSTERTKSSPNFVGKLEDKLLHYTSSGNWILEIVSWLISALCMVAIIGILIGVQNRPNPKWALSFTLNALAKIASAALVLPASEALGQLKWMWFGRGESKKMMDFEVFDNASRGPWGSVLLLIRTRGRSLAALGALVTLLALALDPFFQQLASFPDRWTLQGSSGIPRAQNFAPHIGQLYRKGLLSATADTDMQPVVEKFLFDNGTQPIMFGNGTRPSSIPISCPTSNCTWPPYESLGVCSTCEDVSDVLTWACLHAPVDWYEIPDTFADAPNGTMCGYFVNTTDPVTTKLLSGYIVSMDDSAYSDAVGQALIMRTLPLTTTAKRKRLYSNGSINFSDIRNPIVDFIFTTASDGPASVYRNETPMAIECILSWCVKTIRSSYYLANYEEEVVDVVYNRTQGPSPWVSNFYNDSAGIGYDVYYLENPTILGPGEELYGVNNRTHFNVVHIFDQFLPSWTSVKDVSATPQMGVSVYSTLGPYHRTMNFNPWLHPNNITKHLDRLASAMTNVLRSSPNTEMISGLAFNRETFVSVEWAWISVPLLVLILCGAFLASTIWRSSRDKDSVGGVWKNSALGTLIHGLPDDMQKKMRGSQMVSTPRTMARTLRVKMHGKNGWRVSGGVPAGGQNQPPPGWI
ncbi:hypothetical protein BCR34DRAFT_474758 [Clohesyomyces aquaticus]|uniref:DUF3176 domain containing protein n=1 Tax=Clohesyomyces aquaticus TaxID=1231657 RepID=A0A1Y2A4J6_9PLEO|nr:hypothetical protein BCR34DRAFT_474758 [Clohesyomyces aquaticus]